MHSDLFVILSIIIFPILLKFLYILFIDIAGFIFTIFCRAFKKFDICQIKLLKISLINEFGEQRYYVAEVLPKILKVIKMNFSGKEKRMVFEFSINLGRKLIEEGVPISDVSKILLYSVPLAAKVAEGERFPSEEHTDGDEWYWRDNPHIICKFKAPFIENAVNFISSLTSQNVKEKIKELKKNQSSSSILEVEKIQKIPRKVKSFEIEFGRPWFMVNKGTVHDCKEAKYIKDGLRVVDYLDNPKNRVFSKRYYSSSPTKSTSSPLQFYFTEKSKVFKEIVRKIVDEFILPYDIYYGNEDHNNFYSPIIEAKEIDKLEKIITKYLLGQKVKDHYITIYYEAEEGSKYAWKPKALDIYKHLPPREDLLQKYGVFIKLNFSSSPISTIYRNISDQFRLMSKELNINFSHPKIQNRLTQAKEYLQKIENLLKEGKINPSVKVRTQKEQPSLKPISTVIRIGIYPCAANPLHWDHLLVGLKVIAEQELDKVIFVIQGPDERKPILVHTQKYRFELTPKVLALFNPLFEFTENKSPDGETDIIRILKLNPHQKIDAFYIVGGDHYNRWAKEEAPDNLLKGTDEYLEWVINKGREPKPDTIQKLEENPQKYNLNVLFHKITAVFIQRGKQKKIKTSLDIKLLPPVGDASATAIREALKLLSEGKEKEAKEKLIYLPYLSHQYIKQNPEYLDMLINPEKYISSSSLKFSDKDILLLQRRYHPESIRERLEKLLRERSLSYEIYKAYFIEDTTVKKERLEQLINLFNSYPVLDFLEDLEEAQTTWIEDHMDIGKAIESMIAGRRVDQMPFAGQGTRMDNSLRKLGIELPAEKLRLSNLNVWEIAEQMGLIKSSPPYRKNIGFGEREMLAAEQGILNLKKYYGLTDRKIKDIKHNYKAIVSISKEIENETKKAFLSESKVSGKKFFGFNPKNIVFVRGGYGPEFILTSPNTVEIIKNTKTSWNHGYAFIELAFIHGVDEEGNPKAFTLTEDGEEIPLEEPVFLYMLNKGAKYGVIRRINDLLLLHPFTSIDIIMFASFLGLRSKEEYKDINLYLEMMSNPTGQKGGLALSINQPYLLLIEGLATKNPLILNGKDGKLDLFTQEALNKTQGLRGIPYNRLYGYYVIEDVIKALIDGKTIASDDFDMPLAIKQSKKIPGNISPEMPTGDLTWFRKIKALGGMRRYDFYIDKGILPNEQRDKDNNPIIDSEIGRPRKAYIPGQGAVLHDCKEAKYIKDGLRVVDYLDNPKNRVFSERYYSSSSLKNYLVDNLKETLIQFITSRSTRIHIIDELDYAFSMNNPYLIQEIVDRINYQKILPYLGRLSIPTLYYLEDFERELTNKREEVLRDIKEGKVFIQIMAGGQARRMQDSLFKEGLELPIEKCRIWGLDIIDIAQQLKLIGMSEGKKGISLGTRKFLALRKAIEREFKGGDREIVFNNLKFVIHISEDIQSLVERDLIENMFFGFNHENIVLVDSGYGPAFIIKDRQIKILSSKLVTYNHGYALEALDFTEGYYLNPYNSRQVPLNESVFDWLQNREVEIGAFHRINDLIFLAPANALDIKMFALFKHLKEARGADAIFEMMGNPKGQKGGLALTILPEQRYIIILEGLDANAIVIQKELDELTKSVQKREKERLPGIPYNRLYFIYDIGILRDTLIANRGIIPSIKYRDNVLSFEIAAGNVTYLNGFNALAVVRRGDPLIEKGIIDSSEYLAKGNYKFLRDRDESKETMVWLALIHDIKDVRQFLEACYVALYQDRGYKTFNVSSSIRVASKEELEKAYEEIWTSTERLISSYRVPSFVNNENVYYITSVIPFSEFPKPLKRNLRKIIDDLKNEFPEFYFLSEELIHTTVFVLVFERPLDKNYLGKPRLTLQMAREYRRHIIERIGSKEIRYIFRGVNLTPDGTIIVQGYVDDNTIFELRRYLEEAYPDDTGRRKTPLLHITLARLIRPISYESFYKLFKKIEGKYRDYEIGEFIVSKLLLFEGYDKFSIIRKNIIKINIELSTSSSIVKACILSDLDYESREVNIWGIERNKIFPQEYDLWIALLKRDYIKVKHILDDMEAKGSRIFMIKTPEWIEEIKIKIEKLYDPEYVMWHEAKIWRELSEIHMRRTLNSLHSDIKTLCKGIGLGEREISKVWTAAYELAGNIYRHAEEGIVVLMSIDEGIRVLGVDRGRGITEDNLKLSRSKEEARWGWGGSTGYGLEIMQALDFTLVASSKGNLIILRKSGKINSSPLWIGKNIPQLKDKLIVTISMEGNIPEFEGYDAQNANTKGGLGAYFGDKLEGLATIGMKAYGVQPIYAKLKRGEEIIDVDYRDLQEKGVILRVYDEEDRPLVLKVRAWDTTDPANIYNNPEIPVEVYKVNRGGTWNFLLWSPDVFDVLYTEDRICRFTQEVVFGKAVYLLLKSLNIIPDILHLNEAHTVVAAVQIKQDRDFAKTKVVYTVHTNVPVGLERFHLASLRVDIERMIYTLGLEKNDSYRIRSMFLRADGVVDFCYIAMKLADIINGVSKEHAIAAEKLFKTMYGEDFDGHIIGILNGSGNTWKNPLLLKIERENREIDHEVLFEIHKQGKREALEEVKKCTGIELREDKLTMWAIRRIVDYKSQYPMLRFLVHILCADRGEKFTRGELLQIWFKDIPDLQTEYNRNLSEKVLDYIFSDREYVYGLGIQLVVGGPEYMPFWVYEFKRWSNEVERLRGRFVYVSNSDARLLKMQAIGADICINMPRPLEEACGTSDQRTGLNGGVNIAIRGAGAIEWITDFNEEIKEGSGFLLDSYLKDTPYGAEADLELFYKKAPADILRKVEIASRIFYEDKELWKEIMFESYKAANDKVTAEAMEKRYALDIYRKLFVSSVLEYEGDISTHREEISLLRRRGPPASSALEVKTLPLKTTGTLIKFGTSGWRGILGKDFNMDNVRRCAQGLADYYTNYIKEGYILIGYDPRKGNYDFAKEIASILAANDILVKIIIEEPTPTPVLAYLANSDSKISGVVNLTASHNKYTDDGFKFSPYHGGAAPKEVTDLISEYANKAKYYKYIPYKVAKEKGLIKEVTLKEAIDKYVYNYIIPALKNLGAWQEIINYIKKNPQFKLILDPMQGTSLRYLEAIYREIERKVNREFIKFIHTNNRDPQFSEVNGAPNPTEKESIKNTLQLAKEDKNTIVLLTDGDADRFGVIDFGGKEISANEMIALSVYFFAKKNLKGAVGKTVATSNFVNAISEFLKLELIETAVGFKWFVEKAIKEGKNFLVAGEESAHVGVGPFIKSWDDGIAITLIALWIVASQNKSIITFKKEIEKTIGKQFFYKRDNIPLTKELKEKAAELIKVAKEEENVTVENKSITKLIKSFAPSYEVESVITVDGLKVVFTSGDWLCIRLSGTEPVSRLYTEATSLKSQRSLRQLGANILGVSSSPINTYPLKTPQEARKTTKPQHTEAKVVLDEGVYKIRKAEKGKFVGNQENILTNRLNELTNIIKRGPPEFVLSVTTDFNLTQHNVSGCDISTKTIYLHPYFFNLSQTKQLEILCRELISHIYKGIIEGEETLRDTKEFGRRLGAQGNFFQGNLFENRLITEAFKGIQYFNSSQSSFRIVVSSNLFANLFGSYFGLFKHYIKGIDLGIISNSHFFSSLLRIINIDSDNNNFFIFFYKYWPYLFGSVDFIVPALFEYKIFSTLKFAQLRSFLFRGFDSFNNFFFTGASCRSPNLSMSTQSNWFNRIIHWLIYTTLSFENQGIRNCRKPLLSYSLDVAKENTISTTPGVEKDRLSKKKKLNYLQFEYPARLKEPYQKPAQKQKEIFYNYYLNNSLKRFNLAIAPKELVILVDKTETGKLTDTVTVPQKIAILESLIARAPPVNSKESQIFQALINDVILHETFHLKGLNEE
ncbi:MAG: glycogen/starch synthase, partial [Candidatus Omnitrophica bacterium]|nr:glycogen/starch synthase [Candidatus Omnitrophota bacterium]